jgi:hypothetical protein
MGTFELQEAPTTLDEAPLGPMFPDPVPVVAGGLDMGQAPGLRARQTSEIIRTKKAGREAVTQRLGFAVHPDPAARPGLPSGRSPLQS